MHCALPTVVLLALAPLVLSCGQEGRGSSPPPGSAPTGASPAATIVADGVRKAVCAAEPCGSDASSIRVYRDAGGAVKKLYRLYGACFHSPGIYFDPDGTKTETIPEKPMAPGSDAERALHAKHDAQVGGLIHTDTIRCEDGARLPP